ncbi:MAG: hypothetical protein ACO23V_10505 [Chitinophagaceae bacterium]
MATSSAPFQQGEPLNIDALNQLWNDARTASASISALSTTQAGITGSLSAGIPIFESDVIECGTLGKGVVVTKPIRLTKIDPTRDTGIVVIASVVGVLNSKGDMISVSTKGSGSSWTAYIVTGDSFSGSVNINWIAMAYRSI